MFQCEFSFFLGGWSSFIGSFGLSFVHHLAEEDVFNQVINLPGNLDKCSRLLIELRNGLEVHTPSHSIFLNLFR